MLTAQISLSLSIHPYQPSLQTGPSTYIQCPLRADVKKFLLLDKHWYVHVYGLIEECHVFIPVSLTCLVRLGYVLRWAVGGRTITLLSGIPSRIC